MTGENALAETVGEAKKAVTTEENASTTTVVDDDDGNQTNQVRETPETETKAEYGEKVQKRINSEVGKRKQAEARTQALEIEAAENRGREAARAEAATAAAKATTDETEETPEVPGGRETFETDDEWLKAHKDYDADKIREDMRKEMRENSERATAATAAAAKTQTEETDKAQRATDFLESVNSARENHKDYDDVVRNPELVMSHDLVDAIQSSDNAGEIAYRVAGDLKEAERLSKLPPLSMAREIGKLEARLAEPKKKRTTEAPDPLKPITPTGDAPPKNPDDMNMDEYEAWRYGKKS